MKLEVGKRYMLRNGEITTPLKKLNNDPYVFYANTSKIGSTSWTEDGRFHLDYPNHGYDIVAYVCESNNVAIDSSEEACSKRQWQWGTPCRVGVWAFGGRDKAAAPDLRSVGFVSNASLDFDTGWVAFIMDPPVIHPPLKTITKRMWIRRDETSAILLNPESSVELRRTVEAFETMWLPEADTVAASGWIKTEHTKEFTE